MYIALGILAYFIVGMLVFVFLVKLEIAKVVTSFNIEHNEVEMCIWICSFWCVFLLVLILILPANWAKKRFNK